MELVYLFGGFLFGGMLTYLSLKLHYKNVEKERFAQQNLQEREQLRLDEQQRYLQRDGQELKAKNEELGVLAERRLENMVRLQTENRELQQRLARQEEDLKELHQRFNADFELLAGKILKQNTQEFSLLNQKNMMDILAPLKEKIQLFERKVEDTYEKGLKDQTDLKAELKKLQEMNQRISEDAVNLTRALKGDVKKQGNWGEMILERILERSGLTEGREYEKQFSQMSDQGTRLQPDVVIHLPGNKHIIVDAKVSLVAYERMVSAEADAQYQREMLNHLSSVRQHIKELGDKHYQAIPGLNSPDFVLLFLPIESSFSVAVQADQQLFTYAWDHKVVIVSPSTLLATLRTIASVWQQENQTRHALEIARQGGKLYDKFVRFVDDLEKVGANLETTRTNYTLAMNKLTDGRGNLVRSAEKLREMGARTNKELANKYLEGADIADTE